MGLAKSEAGVCPPLPSEAVELGALDGHSARAPREVADRVERYERLAGAGALDDGRWMDSRELLAWARSAEDR